MAMIDVRHLPLDPRNLRREQEERFAQRMQRVQSETLQRRRGSIMANPKRPRCSEIFGQTRDPPSPAAHVAPPSSEQRQSLREQVEYRRGEGQTLRDSIREKEELLARLRETTRRAEKERERVIEALALKARAKEEMERREKERLLEKERLVHQQLWKKRRRSSKIGPENAWELYETRWDALATSTARTTSSRPHAVAPLPKPLSFRDIPWPLFQVPKSPALITPHNVAAFLLSPTHSAQKTRRERLRCALLLWHPDKFEGRYLDRVRESERDAVQEGVKAVARCLHELLQAPGYP